MVSALAAAFVLGFLGSAHCVGMCGPLVLRLPGNRTSVTMYHTGRLTVYALAGLLFGMIGHQVYLAGWQQGLSVVLGMSILARLAWKGKPLTFGHRWQAWVTRLWKARSRSRFLLMGVANGLLPCGMVYLAIAAAVTGPGPWWSMGFMFFFGLGTLPLLLGIQATGRMAFRLRARRWLPYFTALTAVLLILRGLNLGIPYVSPLLAGPRPAAIECH